MGISSWNLECFRDCDLEILNGFLSFLVKVVFIESSLERDIFRLVHIMFQLGDRQIFKYIHILFFTIFMVADFFTFFSLIYITRSALKHVYV